MKYWKQQLKLDRNRVFTREELMRNRNLRRFKRLRTFFLLVPLSVFLDEVCLQPLHVPFWKH